MGGDNCSDFKRVKEDFEDPILLMNNVKGVLKDLEFIVQHLKRDISCTIESGRRAVRLAVEREIQVLVFGMTEEFVKTTSKLQERIDCVEGENLLLMENEEAIMEELARLTLKKESETERGRESETERGREREKETENLVKELSELQLFIENELDSNKILEKLREYQQLEKDLREANTKIDDLKMENEEKDKAILNLRTENEDLRVKVKEISEEHFENESRIRELMTMNCELMDMSESSRTKEDKLLAENEKLKNEIDSIKKVLTAHKIEIEKNREILSRERKLFSLKISDLQEQILERNLDGENRDIPNMEIGLINNKNSH